MSDLNVCAVDLGNTSGRVTVARYDGNRLRLEEIHRFSNGAVPLHEHVKWDFIHLFRESLMGLAKASDIASLGIDSWATDFGLVDCDNDLVLVPHHQRDPRSDRMMCLFDTPEKQEKWYKETGIAFQSFNTSLQLISMVRDHRDVLNHASSLLMIPDLFIFYLTGVKVSEATQASTTQLVSLRTQTWDWDIIREIGLPPHLLQTIARPPICVGNVASNIRSSFAFSHDPEVVLVGSHDTASALHAAPMYSGNNVLISSGTWSLFGTILLEPLVNSESMRAKYNNERATNGNIRFLKNIMGMWIVEQMRRIWEIQDAIAISYDEMMSLAWQSRSFRSILPPNLYRFYSPRNMVDEIRAFVDETGQVPFRSRGEMIRAVLEGLAFAYRQSLDELSAITGRQFDAVHIIGGGARNKMLNQFTANVCKLPVIAGPAEATTIGNALSQLEYYGEILGEQQRVELVRASFAVEVFQPEETDRWEDHYQAYLSVASAHPF